MKNLKIILIALFWGIVFTSCKKDKKIPPAPAITTDEITSTVLNSATIGGTITADNGGAITDKGVVYSDALAAPNADPAMLAKNPADPATGTGSFTVTLTLIGNKTYDVWAYATNAGGTTYGEKKTIVLDVDGNLYHTVKIGNQVWMKENLKTTRYKNEDPIVNATQGWDNSVVGGWCDYLNTAANATIYGRLYNWYAVNASPDGITKILAPPGWHVPSEIEYNDLIITLGGQTVAGGKMKEAGTGHWQPTNTGADNSSGFTALPGGFRSAGGAFDYLGGYGYWWTSTPNNIEAKYIFLNYNNNQIAVVSSSKLIGASVRCIKNN